MATPSITLYHFPGSTSTFPYLLLEYTGLKYELKISNPSDPDFAVVNPKQQVPVLVVNDEVVTENPAIAHRINQLAPHKHIFGSSPQEFIKVCEWLNWMSATIHAQTWGPYIRPWRFTNDPAAETSVKAASQQKLLLRWSEIESRLSGGGVWSVGDDFTAVDAFLFQFFRFASNGMGIDIQSDYPNWSRLIDRLRGTTVLGAAMDADEKMKNETGRLTVR